MWTMRGAALEDYEADAEKMTVTAITCSCFLLISMQKNDLFSFGLTVYKAADLSILVRILF